MAQPIQGTKPHSFLQDEALRVLAGQVSSAYDSLETSLGVVTNQSLRALGLFTKTGPLAHHVSVRSDQNITIKLVNAGGTIGDVISIDGGIPFYQDWIEMADVLVTTIAASNPMRVIVA